MSKKSKAMFLGAIAVIVVVFLLLVIEIFFSEKQENEENLPSSISHSELSDESISSEIPVYEKEFEKIDFGLEETMEGRSDYFSLTFSQNMAAENRAALNLTPIIENGLSKMSYSGHQIYLSEKDGREYIISGTVAIPYGYETHYDGNGYLREEATGKRIHVFGNVSDLEAFQKNWESGQRILNGETQGEEGMIIFDGYLTPYTFEREGKDILISLREIAPLASPSTYYRETTGYINVYVNEFNTVKVPTTAANSMLQKTFNITGNNFQFTSWNGERFQCWVPVIDATDTQISIENASLIFGWEMYTDGKVLSIVSDQLNVSALTAIRDTGDLGIEVVLEEDEEGKRFSCAYDSNGTLLWKKPFTEPEENDETDKTKNEMNDNTDMDDEFLSQ